MKRNRATPLADDGHDLDAADARHRRAGVHRHHWFEHHEDHAAVPQAETRTNGPGGVTSRRAKFAAVSSRAV